MTGAPDDALVLDHFQLLSWQLVGPRSTKNVTAIPKVSSASDWICRLHRFDAGLHLANILPISH